MRKRIVCLIVLCLFAFANTAFATNWIYVGNIVLGDFYIDADTAVRSGNTLFFWERLDTLDLDTGNEIQELTKFEIKLTKPRQYRWLELRTYDRVTGKTKYDNKPSEFRTFEDGCSLDMDVKVALKYARTVGTK